MKDDYRGKGYYHFIPYTTKKGKKYLTADAVAKEYKPGAKAGNPCIDDVNEVIKQEQLIKRMKKEYRKLKREESQK